MSEGLRPSPELREWLSISDVYYLQWLEKWHDKLQAQLAAARAEAESQKQRNELLEHDANLRGRETVQDADGRWWIRACEPRVPTPEPADRFVDANRKVEGDE